MRKLLPVIASLLLFLVACSQPAAVPEDAASQAAKDYYDLLLAGRYDDFLNGKAGTANLPESYRTQLTDALRQFVAQQEARGGITSVSISPTMSACMDTVLHVMQAFLVLNYADSTHEEIVVPMVEQGGVWMMR